MAHLASLNSKTFVSGQVDPADLGRLAAEFGIKRIVSNRPDHEDPDQPTADDVAAAAQAAGLDFLSAPMRGMPSSDSVKAVADFIAQDGATLLFCRSGMRSAVIWALAEASNGAEPAKLRQAAFDAGFDLSSLPL